MTARWATTGCVTALIPEYEAWADQAFACGPYRMLAALARLAAGRRAAARASRSWAGSAAAGSRLPVGSPEARRKAYLQVSMEQNMGCAVGACLGCVVMGVSGTPQRVCREGPVFAYDEIDWEEGWLQAKRREGEEAGGHRAAHGADADRSPIKPAIVPAPRVPASGPAGARQACSRRRREPRSVAPAVDALGGGEVDLSVDLGRGLVLPNPILVASGTFGYGVEYGDVVDVQRLGAICCKGTTLKARIGNPTPRVTETPGGMLNSIGLQNPGVDAVIEKYGKTWAGWQVPVIVNVAGESVADYVECVRRLDGVPGVAGIELNISLSERRQGRAAVRDRCRRRRARSRRRFGGRPICRCS